MSFGPPDQMSFGQRAFVFLSSQDSGCQSGVTQMTGGEAGSIRVSTGSFGIGTLVFAETHFAPSALSHVSPTLNFRPSVVLGCIQPLQCASSWRIISV